MATIHDSLQKQIEITSNTIQFQRGPDEMLQPDNKVYAVLLRNQHTIMIALLKLLQKC